MNKIYISELYHHGIEGQKWGQRNGPPYPLNPKDYSSKERKAIKKIKDDKYKTERKQAIKEGRHGGFGKTLAKNLLFGPFGTKQYNTLVSMAGYSRGKAAVATLATGYFTTYVGQIVGNSLAKNSVKGQYTGKDLSKHYESMDEKKKKKYKSIEDIEKSKKQ